MVNSTFNAIISENKHISINVKEVYVDFQDSINAIKFVYDNGTNIIIGNDRCNDYNIHNPIRLTKNEYIVEVSHEEYINFQKVGAAISFTTNKGRTFEYNSKKRSRLSEEITTFKVKPKHQITKLNIVKGKLISIEQNIVRNYRNNVNIPWYTVASYKSKTDEELTEDTSGCVFHHFYSYKKANSLYNTIIEEKIKGITVFLIDSKNMNVVKCIGKPIDIIYLEKECSLKGFIKLKDNKKFTISSGWNTFTSLIRKKSDKRNFSLIVSFLWVSSYLDIYGSLITGKILTMFENSSDSDLEENFKWVKVVYCMIGDCSGKDQNYEKKAIILGYLVVMVTKTLFYVSNVYIHNMACEKNNSNMDIESLKKVMSLDQTFFDTISTSELRNNMNVRPINDTITWNIPYLLSNILKLITACYFMISISPKLGILSILFTVFTEYFVLENINKREEQYQRSNQKIQNHLSQIKDEALDMITTVKLFSNENHHISNYKNGKEKYLRRLKNIVSMRVIREFTSLISKSLIFSTVLYIGIMDITDKNIDASSLTGFFMIYVQYQTVIGYFKWNWNFFKQNYPQIERFLALMNEKPSLIDKFNNNIDNNLKGNVIFKDVEFSYPSRPNEKTLKGVSFNIEPNKMTAIVGDSGAGKSTIINLIMRIYDTSVGGVFIDGVNVKDFSLKSLHDKVSIVPQTPDLFNLSVYDNISYGCGRNVSKDDIISVAKIANCYDFIMKLTNGFDTFVGNRGSQLSIGQKQRIAIARAGIRNPHILILDEATSALDAENEKLIQDALEKLMKNKTIIVIAHRLCTIKNADNIICMKDGVVLENGSHRKLMKKKGAFYSLIKKQI